MRAVRVLVLAGLAGVVLAAGAGPAPADPSSPPPVTSIVAVGADTTRYVADQFSTDYDKTGPANPFYSWDMVNPSTGLQGDTIKSKNDANCSMFRPAGPSPGILQLQKQVKATNGTDYCVDTVGASRNIKASDGQGITSVLFAKDLITWGSNSGGNGSAVANLTEIDLTAIYTCNASLINSSFSGPVKWSEVGGTSTDAIIPVVPQSNSGTRAQWLTDIGVSTVGTCVVNGTYNGGSIQENDGTNPVFTAAGNPGGYKDVLSPYSGGVYVCQVYTKKCPDKHGTLSLRDIDGKNWLTSSNTINVTGIGQFAATFVRGLYFVTFNAGSLLTPKVPTSPIDLSKLFGQGNAAGWICASATARTDIADFGFVVPSNCGALTAQ